MLRSVLLLLLLSCVCDAKYTAKCSNNTEDSFVFEPAEDNVEGRYKVEWCTRADRNVSDWELLLYYNEKKSPAQCKVYDVFKYWGNIHSRQIEPVMLDLNCTNVCLLTHLDLIFNKTCYHLQSVLRRDQKSSTPHNSVHYITNNYSKEHFTNSESRVSPEDYDDRSVIRWFLGYVPAASVDMLLCHDNNDTGEHVCSDIGANCTIKTEENEIVCELRRAALAAGCYNVWMRHHAAWVAGDTLFENIKDGSHKFCSNQVEVGAGDAASVWVSAGGVLQWVGGAAGVALLLLLLLALARTRRLAAWRARVLGDWSSRPEEEVFKESTPCGRVFLLYARDCDLFVEVAQQLKLMLQKAGFQVVDVYGCDTLAASASATGDWTRQLVARPDTRLLLLQSPAADALYTAQLGPGARPRLERPLLWERAVPRRPRAGDELLLLALRLLVEGAHAPPAPGAPPAYRKYYLAEVAGLEADLFPQVTPLRRYQLPAAAPALLRDLGGAGAAAGGVGGGEGDAARLAGAARRLLQHVRAHPDYLSDELRFS